MFRIFTYIRQPYSDHNFVNRHVYARIYNAGMQNRRPILVKLPPDLIDDLDAFCASQPIPSTRTAAIEVAIRKLLADAKRKR